MLWLIVASCLWWLCESAGQRAVCYDNLERNALFMTLGYVKQWLCGEGDDGFVNTTR